MELSRFFDRTLPFCRCRKFLSSSFYFCHFDIKKNVLSSKYCIKNTKKSNFRYYVSQASFYPTPPKWEFDGNSLFVPPAKPLVYSQIPFYLTGLTDTTTIVKMIHDIRSICDRFTDHNLPNFPSGTTIRLYRKTRVLFAMDARKGKRNE